MREKLTERDVQKIQQEIEHRKLVVRKEAIEAVKELTEDRVIRLWNTTDGNNKDISIKNRYKNALHKSGGRYLTS